MHNITRTLVLTSLKCILLLFFVISFDSSARADISWMKAANNCRLFEPALNAYLDRVDIERYDSLPFWQREELAIVLREACHGKFEACGLGACKRWGTLASVDQSNSSKAGLPSDATTGLPSMTWLNRFLTCEQLIEQIQGRYATLEPDQISSPKVKKELAYVLDVSCGARFQHCKFRSCSERKKTPSLNISEATTLDTKSRPQNGVENSETEIPIAEDLLNGLANQRLSKLVSDYRALRIVKIKAEMSVEKKEGRSWVRLANPYEAKVIAERREAIKERKLNYQEQLAEEEENKNSKYKGYRAPKGTPRPYTPGNNRRRERSKPGSGALPF
jgi:hypothetical protein